MVETLNGWKNMVRERRRTYIAIDLKSFFASVECVERNLNPLTTNLVVADISRTEKTICLAVSPSLKSYGIAGRARLFEVVRKVRAVNYERLCRNGGRAFSGKSYDDTELKAHPELELSYIVAQPGMKRYIDYSTRVYAVYLKYIAPEDIHVYSIDEVFIDATEYLGIYKMTAHQLAMKLIREVLSATGVTATAGIGPNLFLSKVAMDIVAKHIPADKDGVRIAELDEMSYRHTLWDHRPITDFWRVGKGTAEKLGTYGMYTMGDVAWQSEKNEELLYKLFGVNAELLIDHAWGWEPCTIEAVKAYKPETNSMSRGQVLKCPYTFMKARVVVREMAQGMALELLDKHKVTNRLTLTIGYDAESLTNNTPISGYKGEIKFDRYGRKVPKSAHGTESLGRFTSSAKLMTDAVTALFERIADAGLLVRRMNLTAEQVIDENSREAVSEKPLELDLFSDYDAVVAEREKEKAALDKERKVQEAVLRIRKTYGNNALLKGLDFDDGATAMERNVQIGGHKA